MSRDKARQRVHATQDGKERGPVMDLEDRTVLVTGANRGLGASLVDVALDRGAAKVYAAARDPESLAGAAERSGGRVVPVRLDVTRPEQIEAAATTGDVDLLISNAGITSQAPILAAPDIGDFRRTMEVNYFGSMLLLRAFAEQLRQRRGGVIMILSVAAVSLSRSAPAYSASKAAALMLGSSVREELREHGVAVTVSLPGWIDTEMAAGLAAEKATPREVAERSVDGHLAGDDVVWPDRFATLVRTQVDTGMLDLLSRPRAVMNTLAAEFAGGSR
ncbi:short-chain dehydrogenase [Prauserella sp. PE36]|uniref:SDR family NAD(P)-dependent oxidoreductase n=2 Tax=Prauserella endophytica TaxID=1592324 RepID=A0ABY2S5W5_9PSEU|nr:short-chain dehydrogenase [Prauserella sp. PE36]TKG70967.1 SDR family NAD(P)-dependent oxidoreductase [Prauserella endophytica]